MKSLSRVRLFVIPWSVAYQVPLSMGFSRQEYWSGLPFPSPGDLPDTGIEPEYLPCRQTLYRLSHQGSPKGDTFANAGCGGHAHLTEHPITAPHPVQQCSPVLLQDKLL